MSSNQIGKDNQIAQSNKQLVKSKGSAPEYEELVIEKDKNKNPRYLTSTKVQKKLKDEDDLQSQIIELQNQIIQSNPLGSKDLLEAYQKNEKKFLEIPIVKMFYNNAFHDEKLDSIKQYESKINKLLAPLEWLKVSNVEGKFLNVHHKAGSEIIVEFFMPYYDYSVDVLRNKNTDEILATKLSLINRSFPFYKTVHYSAPGNNKSNTSIGGEQGKLTYAMKFANSFGFLRTIGYKNTQTNNENLKNMIDVVKEFKKNLLGVDYSYSLMFNYSMDYIAHYYLLKNIAPNKTYFTLNRLNILFSMDVLKALEFFYSQEDINNHKDLILDNIEISNDFNVFEKLKEIFNNKDLMIQDDIEDSTFASRKGKMVNELGQENINKISSFNEHLIPIDYFRFIAKLRCLIEFYIQQMLLPGGSDINPIDEGKIFEIKNTLLKKISSKTSSSKNNTIKKGGH